VYPDPTLNVKFPIIKFPLNVKFPLVKFPLNVKSPVEDSYSQYKFLSSLFITNTK